MLCDSNITIFMCELILWCVNFAVRKIYYVNNFVGIFSKEYVQNLHTEKLYTLYVYHPIPVHSDPESCGVIILGLAIH